MGTRKKKVLRIVALALVLVTGIIRAWFYFAPLKIRHIELVATADNRLRMLLKVSTNHSCDAVVAYWQPHSGDTLYSAVSRGTDNHSIYLTNLQGPQKYEFEVLAYSAGRNQSQSSRVHNFSTEPIYQATPYFSLDTLNPVVEKDIRHTYFLTQILTEPGSAVIINYRGEIVWYVPFKKGVKVSHWTADKTVLCIIGAAAIPASGGDEIIETDVTGKVLTDLVLGKGGMDKLVHHEVRKDQQGNIYALTFDKRVFDLSPAGGLKKDTVSGDGIVVFSPLGKKLWEWSVFDHLDPLKDSMIVKRKKDWVHANALYKEESGNFLISFRDLNQVWEVNGRTGGVNWKFGMNGDFELPDADTFSAQHAVHINSRGQLMLLDNGIRRKISRALSFRMDTVSRKAIPDINVALSAEYFSPSKGNVVLLDHNRMLFCLTDPRVFLITDGNGEILWKITVAGDPYRLEPIADFLPDKPGWP